MVAAKTLKVNPKPRLMIKVEETPESEPEPEMEDAPDHEEQVNIRVEEPVE